MAISKKAPKVQASTHQISDVKGTSLLEPAANRLAALLISYCLMGGPKLSLRVIFN